MIRWHAQEIGGGALEVTVEYSADGGRSYRPIYTGPNDGSVLLPSYLLSASRNARVRLYVSDGFNEAIVTSPRFIARGAPPMVHITNPTTAIRIPAGATVNLAGTAYDDQGAMLSGRALVWRSGRQMLGHGTQITTTALPAGRHRVTLTARDPAGRTTSASVSVTILNSPPVLTALGFPGRISPTARSLTLRVATLVPDTLKIGRARVAVNRRPKLIHLRIKAARRRWSSSSSYDPDATANGSRSRSHAERQQVWVRRSLSPSTAAAAHDRVGDVSLVPIAGAERALRPRKHSRDRGHHRVLRGPALWCPANNIGALRKRSASSSLPLKRLSTNRLLIARDARSSKHSERYVLVEGGFAFCHAHDRPAEQKRTSASRERDRGLAHADAIQVVGEATQEHARAGSASASASNRSDDLKPKFDVVANGAMRNLSAAETSSSERTNSAIRRAGPAYV